MSTQNRRTVALYPMKAHSARVTSKNFREMAGKALFWWMLDEMIALPEIDLIVINTDAREILAANGLSDGHAGKVMVRDRKPELCGDFVSMNLVLGDDVAHVPADRYFMTHTTNPLLSANTIRRGLAAYDDAIAGGAHDSLFAVNRIQTRFYRADASPVNHDPANLIRTQDLEPWFEENSNFYIFSPESFARTHARIGKTPVLFETPKLESMDIDGPDEWSMAEAVALYRHRNA